MKFYKAKISFIKFLIREEEKIGAPTDELEAELEALQSESDMASEQAYEEKAGK